MLSIREGLSNMNRPKREKLLALQKKLKLHPEKRALLENKRFKTYLSDFTNLKSPPTIQNHPLMQKIHEISDETKVLILRALIYNPRLTSAFILNDTVLMKSVEQLVSGNKKLNIQMTEPIDTRVRSCSGDTLMHCAARMGLRRLLVYLYNAGAADSLILTNSHGYTPFDSVLNQMDRITEDPALTMEEKFKKNFNLEKVRNTLNNLEYRKIIKNQNAIAKKLDVAYDEQKELGNILTSIPSQVVSNGVGGVVGTLGRLSEWLYKKVVPQKTIYISEDSAHTANIKKQKGHHHIPSNFVVLYGAPSPTVIEYMIRNIRERN